MPDGLRAFFRNYPVTAFIASANVVTFLLIFFGLGAPLTYLAVADLQTQPWAILTYPLIGQGGVIGVALMTYMLWWVGRSLEGTWGHQKFAQVFVTVSIGFALSMWVGGIVVRGQGIPLSGIWFPFAGLFIMWAMMNPRAVVLFFFVLPIEARFLGYLDLVLLYFNTGPVLGLFAIAPGLLSWLYVSEWYRNFKRQRSSRSKGVSKPRKSKSRARLKVIDGGLKDAPVADRTPPPELDKILDKINKQGMESLTELEKATLDSYSARLRGDEA